MHRVPRLARLALQGHTLPPLEVLSALRAEPESTLRPRPPRHAYHARWGTTKTQLGKLLAGNAWLGRSPLRLALALARTALRELTWPLSEPRRACHARLGCHRL